MISIEIPKDLNNVRSKFIGPFTRRQTLFLGLSGLIGFPIYFFVKSYIGNDFATFVMIIITSPLMLLGFGQKDGRPYEKYLNDMFQMLFIRSRHRPYQTDNFYETLNETIKLRSEYRRCAIRYKKCKEKSEAAKSIQKTLARRQKKNSCNGKRSQETRKQKKPGKRTTGNPVPTNVS